MTDSEREFVIQYLEETRGRVRALASSLTPPQRGVRASENEWSAAELIEHITVVEKFSQTVIEKMLAEGAPDESRRGKGAHKDRLILDMTPARTTRVQAPPGFHPEHRWANFDELLREFEATRDRTIELARTAQKDLRVYFATHPFLKDLDGYQWLLLMGAHTERHVRQAEESLAKAAGQS